MSPEVLERRGFHARANSTGIKDSPPHQGNTERARAGVNVRYVLSFGLIAVIIAFAIVYLIYFH